MFEAKSPFERLRALLENTEPGRPPVDLTVGGPRQPIPPFIADVIAENVAGFRNYPPIAGSPAFQRAANGYLNRRYGIGDWFEDAGALLPTSGSRDGLFFAAITARDWLQKDRPAILFANPFYQTYGAAAHAVGAEPIPMAAKSDTAILPDWDAVPTETLDRAIAYYVASPSNPQGINATLSDWHALLDRAERHNFLIFADECYADLYRETVGPPPGILNAVAERRSALPRAVYFHSLSKRSNLAGMRCGFVAGDRALIGAMKDFRNQAAPQVPGPLQAAAAAAYADDAHVVENRRLYDEKFAIADEILGPLCGKVSPPGGFFLWLPARALASNEDDEALCVALWREQGVRTVPGSYLALTQKGQQNPGRGYIRLALVADATVTREALGRVKHFADRGLKSEHVAFAGVRGGIQ